MKRRFVLCLVVALGGAGCGSAAEQQTTSAAEAAEPSTTTTTEAVATTTAVTVGPVDLCRGRSVLWEPEVAHVADCFAVPVSFSVGDGGWRSRGAKADTVFVSWVDASDEAVIVSVGLAVRRGGGQVRSDVESVVQREGIAALGPITEESVAGFAALMVDVEGMRLTGDAVTAADGEECLTNNRVVLHFRREAYVIAGPFPSLGGEFFGVGACQIVRVWVFEVGEFTVTIIGGTGDPSRHQIAVAKIEELLQGMSFDTGGGS